MGITFFTRVGGKKKLCLRLSLKSQSSNLGLCRRVAAGTGLPAIPCGRKSEVMRAQGRKLQTEKYLASGHVTHSTGL